LEEAKKKEEKKKTPPVKKSNDPNDIFTEKDVDGGQKKTEVKYKRDVTPMPDYYKAWDTFDVDEALGSDEEE